MLVGWNAVTSLVVSLKGAVQTDFCCTWLVALGQCMQCMLCLNWVWVEWDQLF